MCANSICTCPVFGVVALVDCLRLVEFVPPKNTIRFRRPHSLHLLLLLKKLCLHPKYTYTYSTMKPTSHSTSGSFLRILCLHDDDSHAMELSNSLEVLGERLFEKHGIDLIYVNSPLVSRSRQVLGPQELPNRVWWEEQAPGKTPASQSNDSPWKDDGDDDKSEDDPNSQEAPHDNANDKNLVGLDASLLLLKQVWNSMPFWGILAIGKGAAVGSFLPLMGLSPEPSFCCFVHGESLLEETEQLVDIPCLHIVGT